MKLDSLRVRRPSKGFGWVDHRIISANHLVQMEPVEGPVYLLLCVVADRHGISYYNPSTLARLIKVSPTRAQQALTSLAARNLIAIEGRFIQVVDLDDLCSARDSLPEGPVVESRPTPSNPEEPKDREPPAVIFAQLPAPVQEDLLTRARHRMARFLGTKAPSQGVLEALAVALLRQENRS